MILRVLKEFEQDEIYEIKEKEVSIGRDHTNDIVILDDMVSRKHARIIFENGTYWLEDLNSTNGTYLNNVPIERTPLKTGDKINIGKATIIIQDTEQNNLGKPSVHIIESDKNNETGIYSITAKDAARLISEKAKEDLEVLKKENETLKKLFQLNNIINSTRNISVLINKIIDLTNEMIDADNVCVLLLDEKKEGLRVNNIRSKSGNQTVIVSKTIVNHVLKKGNAVLVTDAFDDKRFSPHKSIISANIKSVICTPIQSQRIFGIFYADIRSDYRKFNEDDLKIVSILSNMIGIALENDYWHREAIRRERLSVIGEVITGLSHYAKNILNGLRLAIQALEFSLPVNDKEKIYKSLNAIKAQEKRISNLVLNMLDYSKERKPIKQKADLKELIKDIADPYADYFNEHNIEFILDIDDDFPEVFIDTTGIHRVLLNLFTNALDAVKKKEKGIIKISAKLKENKDEFVITVEDNGIGIEKKLFDKIFDVFYSTKSFEGTGLGLAVAKKIIEEHKGKIFVESEKGKGSKFVITLPLK